MALTITGKVHSVGNTQSIASKNGGQPFLKREIVLDATRFDPYTGERDKFENFPQFEFSGEKCSELDGFKTGDVVEVSFELQGSFYKDKDGVEKNFTRVRAYKIEHYQTKQRPAQQQAAQPQPMPSDYPPPPAPSGLPF